MNRYCIWFVTPDHPVSRHAEITLAGTIHNHHVLDDIERRLAASLQLPRIHITDWKRFEDPPQAANPAAA